MYLNYNPSTLRLQQVKTRLDCHLFCSSDEYYSNKQDHKTRRYHHKQNSLTSSEAMRIVPPAEDERRDKLEDRVKEDIGQKRQNRGGDTNRRSSLLQTRLESLKSTSNIVIEAKQPLARKRWFDAFDHVCRQLNEVNNLNLLFDYQLF